MVKIDRSMPAPESLDVEKAKRCGTYNTDEVVRRLREDFFDKCYLCEIKPVQDIEIEHLKPHKNGENIEAKFDWNNLFLSCRHCNSVKNNREYDAGILDCCKVDPEDYISFKYTNDGVVIEVKEKSNETIYRTVKLLNEIYNKENTGIRIAACEVRVSALANEMVIFYKAVLEYIESPSPLGLRKVKVLLDRSSAFAAFKRQYIRDNGELFKGLTGLLS
mgnify:CR=1 FL=1